ncbi:MAG: antitoxin [Spirochaetales bacterium]|nr:antitoxin [Spirochaetales bacterium]
MKKTEGSLALLIAELEADLAALTELQETNTRAKERLNTGASDDLDYAALGYTLHNIYNLVENSFFRIAKHFENSLSAETWHKDLIQRMTLNIAGIRPAVIDQPTADLLDELRSFRHVFRNMYRKKLDSNKLLALQSNLPETLEGFRLNLAGFIHTLKEAR